MQRSGSGSHRGGHGVAPAWLARIEDGLDRERRFVADASHQLRTPLALLKAELALALKPGRTEQELQAAIASAAEQTDRLTRIADDLLLLARAEQGELRLKTEEVDVMDVLEDVAGRFRTERKISVAPGEPIVLTADRLRLEQALTNLVDNALRHGGGDITVSAVAENGTAELHVVDKGPGFGEDFLPLAFERFTRGDDGNDEEGAASASRSWRRSHVLTAARRAPRTPTAAARTSGSRCRSDERLQ